MSSRIKATIRHSAEPAAILAAALLFARLGLVGATGCGDDVSGTGGDGGFGGGPSVDKCPGESHTLELDQPLTLTDSTEGLNSDFAQFCKAGDSPGPDAVFSLVASKAGTLKVSAGATQPSDPVPTLALRSTCASAQTLIGCGVVDAATKVSTMAPLAMAKGDRISVFIDGASTMGENFELHATLSTPKCGDGAVNAPEECDFGPTEQDSHGCDSASCNYQPVDLTSDTCAPGINIGNLGATPSLTIAGFTNHYSDDYPAPCGAQSGGADRVYYFVAPGDGHVTIHTAGLPETDFDIVLGVYNDSCAGNVAGELLDCSDDTAEALASEAVTVAVTQAKTYFVVVDGYRHSEGKFTLHVDFF